MKSYLKLAAAVSLIIAFTAACSYSVPKQAEARINLATYNIRYHNHDDSVEGNGWGQRLPYMAELIRYHDFDIFGTQEGYDIQLRQLGELLPGYEWIGAGRDDGHDAGEHSAIFYRTDMFDLLDNGDFWMSETPGEPSVGWDAVLPRICTWGHFRDRTSGVEFMMFNLHMDHVGKQARIESAKLVRQMIDSLGHGLPAIVTGDFNVDQNHQSYGTMTTDSALLDSYEAARLRYALNGTFNAFRPDIFTRSRIDHIFVTPGIEVERYGILTDTYRSVDSTALEEPMRGAPTELRMNPFKARTPSDHFPVKTTLVLH